MSKVLYYSNLCEPSKKLLQKLSKVQFGKLLHFVCIDKRTAPDATGNVHVILGDGNKIILPKTITCVPALLLMDQNYKVLTGEQIMQHLEPYMAQAQTTKNREPVPAATQQHHQQFIRGQREQRQQQQHMAQEMMQPAGVGGFSALTCGTSDNFSFLEDTYAMPPIDNLSYGYSPIDISERGVNMQMTPDDTGLFTTKIKTGDPVHDKFKQQREADDAMFGHNRKPTAAQMAAFSSAM
jgi:hypothetical protein